ncbi:hypothetical protein FB451DRAFT_1407990 [Mycena latifolia]|nr:hypothetical protein FB451DRAFT_1407990 [Mycena latifolia]
MSDLCMELLQEIGSLTSVPDQTALRAVSRHFRWAIEPLWFAANPIVLDLRRHPDVLLQQLKALAAGDTGFSHISRKLVIRSLLPAVDDQECRGKVTYQRIQKLLHPALHSLKAVQTVKWAVKENVPGWARAAVFDFLATSASLEVLRLPLPLCGFGDMWKMLQEHDVQLKEVHIAVANENAFLQYLASYSGLERLVIRNAVDVDAARVRLGDFFWESVVPRHANTLAALVCPAYWEGAWAFGTHNIALVSKLQHLDTLELTVNSDSRETGPLKEMVVSFLEMASDMPALRTIAMLAAMPAPDEVRRGCGMRTWRHRSDVQKQIDEAAKSFGAAEQSATVARLIESHYRRSEAHARERL